MSFRNVAFLLLLALAGSVFAEEEGTPSATPSPGFFKRAVSAVNPFHKKDRAPEDKTGKTRAKKLELTMEITPQPLKLSETHEIQVKLVLTNNSRQIVQLDFPTTQRIEVLLRNQAGKLVAQWSEEQSFVNDPGYVTINPREHVEYTASVSGRDMVAGQSYTVEGFFPNFEELKVSKTIVPVQ